MVGRGKMGEPQKTIGQQYGNPVFATLFSLTFLFTPLYTPTIHIPTIHCLHCFCACFACCLASLQFLSKKTLFKEGFVEPFFFLSISVDQENGGNENEDLCCVDGGLDGLLNHAKGCGCRRTSTKPNI